MSAPFIPAELPEKPEGWTRKMTLHMSFEDGGTACFCVIDPEGRETCIAYQYDTRKATPAIPASGKRKAKPGFEPMATGFHVPAARTEVFSKWADLHAAWPSILAAIPSPGAAPE